MYILLNNLLLFIHSLQQDVKLSQKSTTVRRNCSYVCN